MPSFFRPMMMPSMIMSGGEDNEREKRLLNNAKAEPVKCAAEGPNCVCSMKVQGLEVENLDVKAENEHVTLSGQKKVVKKDMPLSEDARSKQPKMEAAKMAFSQEFDMPFSVVDDKIQADFDTPTQTLRITIPTSDGSTPASCDAHAGSSTTESQSSSSDENGGMTNTKTVTKKMGNGSMTMSSVSSSSLGGSPFGGFGGHLGFGGGLGSGMGQLRGGRMEAAEDLENRAINPLVALTSMF